MASVTVTLPGSGVTVTDTLLILKSSSSTNISLGTSLARIANTTLWLNFLRITRSGNNIGFIILYLAASESSTQGNLAGPEFSSEMLNEGTITFTASNGTSVAISGIEDTNEPYNWQPTGRTGTNLQALLLEQWAHGVAALTDKTVTITFDDGQNLPPTATAQSNISVVDANGVVQLTGTATDGDTPPDPLTYLWTANPNIGTFSDPTALSPTWTAPGPTQNDRNVVLTLTATEPDANLMGSASVTVTVRANRRPIVSASAGETTIDSGGSSSYTGIATDPEGQPLTYSWSSDVGGAFSNPTGLSGTWTAPAVMESTTATLTFTASDGITQNSATATVIIRAPATLPLMLPAIPNQTSATGDIVNFMLPIAQDGLTPYIYSAAGLPRGMGFRNRFIRGRPDLPGTYQITYQVTDSNQDMVTRTFFWTITGQAIPQPTGLNLRIDWGEQFYANAHSDITGRITSSIYFERGRNTASAILGRSQAGTLRCELKNDDGLYDQENTASDLAGLIRPGIQVQLRNGVTPLWTGVLDSIPTRFQQSGQHRAVLEAFGVLSNAIEPTVSAGSLTAESTAQAFIELCVKGDVPYESPQPMPGDAYVMGRWWEVGKLKGALDVIEDTEGGFIFEDREGEVGFHLANYRPTRSVNKTFVSQPPLINQLRIVGNPRRELAVKDVHNIVEGTVRQFETQTNETLYTNHESIPIALGGRVDLVAIWDPRRGAVTELNALTGWTAHPNADGSGADRTSRVNITIELMDFNEIHITIVYPTGAGFDDTLYVRGLTVTGSLLTITTPLTVSRRDTVSVERYRPKTLPLENTWVRSVTDMETRADAILDAIAEPERRVSLDWIVNDWADFLSLDLSDRVRVDLPTIQSDGFVEGVGCLLPVSGVNITATMDISLID